MFALSWFSYTKNYEQTIRELEKECEYIQERLAQTILSPVWNMDEDQAVEIIRLELRSDSVDGIAYHYKDDYTEISLAYGKNEADEIVPIGTLSLYFTNVPTVLRLKLEFQEQMLRTAIVTLIILSLSFLYFRKSILKPISLLTDTVKRFGEGNWTARTRIRRNDELGALSGGFNEMASKLAENELSMEK